MSQNQGWEPQDNIPAAQKRPSDPGFPQPGVAPLPGMMAPGMPVPAGMYFDPASGLTLSNGTELATHGRRTGAYFLAGLLCIVTLVIGYAIWG